MILQSSTVVKWWPHHRKLFVQFYRVRIIVRSSQRPVCSYFNFIIKSHITTACTRPIILWLKLRLAVSSTQISTTLVWILRSRAFKYLKEAHVHRRFSWSHIATKAKSDIGAWYHRNLKFYHLRNWIPGYGHSSSFYRCLVWVYNLCITRSISYKQQHKLKVLY